MLRPVGERSIPSWEDQPKYMKDCYEENIKFHLSGETTSEEYHNRRVGDMIEKVWEYGTEIKTGKYVSDNLMAYNELPLRRRINDSLFKAVADTFKQ